jgi:UDP-2-acetamido-3-amino-2,3-dideoxy-glucuronate N-acetyltransferase
LIYEPAVIEDGVFIGPAAILTNDKNPKAVNKDGSLKSASDWKAQAVKIRKGASIGAGAICVAPVEIGPNSMVGAGSVVTRAVKPGQTVVGVPARPID